MKLKISTEMICAFLVLIISISSSGYCFAENTKVLQNENKQINANNVEEFTDSFMSKNMESNSAPGAVVVVVKDGKIIFKKGYGYSDVTAKTPMDADNTLLNIGSVGKLFTQTAAMQLYERGKLKLNVDINTYLGNITINSPFSNKVTIANLLTHTDGFEESSLVGSASKTYDGKISYEEFIRNHIPKVVENPGTVMEYTNIGTDILGFIVQRVSGESYSDYIQNNIFTPLQMNSSAVSPKIMPRGYTYINGQYEKCPDVFFNSPGAGDVVLTGNDMAKFMMAHLQNGTNTSILKPETLNEMHKQHFSSNPQMSGMAYGFYEANQNGLRVIKHDGGAVQGFVSNMFLIPEENVGVFISTNSMGSDEKKNSLTLEYQKEFINYFYNQTGGELKPTECKDYFKKLVGTYRCYDGVSKVRISKLAALFPPGFDSTVEIDSDNNLLLTGSDLTGKEIKTKLCEVEPYLFKRMDNGGYVSFKVDSNGNGKYLCREDEPFDYYEKIGFYETMPFNLALLGFCMLFFSLIFIISTVKLLRKCIKKQKFSNEDINVLLAGTISFLNLSGIIGILSSSMIYYMEFQFAMPKIIYVFLIELILAIVITIILVMRVITTRKSDNSLKNKILVGGVIAISIIFTFFASYWNLIGFNW